MDARNKYDGTRRSPWNEVECGDHYTRPMAGFLLFEIASGQVYDCNYMYQYDMADFYVYDYIGSNGMYRSSPFSLPLD